MTNTIPYLPGTKTWLANDDRAASGHMSLMSLSCELKLLGPHIIECNLPSLGIDYFCPNL